MERQKTLNNQSNLEKEKQSWRKWASWLQNILQSYSNQDNTILAEKQKYTLSVQDRKPRDNAMHIWSPNLWQRRQEYTMEKRQSLQNRCWENCTGACKQMKSKHSRWPLTKINSKWIKDLKVISDTIKLLQGNVSRELFDINHSKIFSDSLPRVMKIKAKISK